MALVITNNPSNLQFDEGTRTIKTFPKGEIEIVNSGNDTITIKGINVPDYDFLWTDVSTPSMGTKEALLAWIIDALTETVSVTGTVTAAVDFSDNIGYETDAAASTDTGNFTLISLFKRLLSRLSDVISGTVSFFVKGKSFVSAAPQMTLNVAGGVYPAGGVFNQAGTPINLVFNNVIDANGGEGYITDVTVFISDTTAAVQNIPGTLYIFNTAPTAIADRSLFATNIAAFGSFQGGIPTSGFKYYAGDASISVNNLSRLRFKCDSNSTTLYGQFVADAAYTRAGVAYTLDVKIGTVRV